MNSNWQSETLSRHKPILVLLGILVFLSAFLLACSRAPSAADVEAAIAQTVDAKMAFGTAVAEEIARQAGNIPDAAGANSGASSENPQGCVGSECSTLVADQVEQTVEAVLTSVQEDEDATAEATILAGLENSDTPTDEELTAAAGGKGGGPAENAACLGGEYEICASNNSASNVNIRTGPGTQWPFQATMHPGDALPVVCRLNYSGTRWLNVIVSIGLGQDGWVSESYVTIDGGEPSPCAEIPPTPVVYPTVTPTATPTPTPTPTATATPTATPEPDIFAFAFNGSSYDVCRLEVFPATNSSGSNRLGSNEVLEPLETKAVNLAADADGKNYVFKAWDCASDPKTAPPLAQAVLEVNPGMTWTITDP